jgi:hypothetical protein
MKFEGTKLSVLRDIEIGGDGEFWAIIAQVVLDENGAILGSRTHRLGLTPLVPVDEAVANFHDHSAQGIEVSFPESVLGKTKLPRGKPKLDENGDDTGELEPFSIVYPPLSDDDVAAIRAKAAELWTDAIVAKHQRRRRKADEAAAAAEVARVAEETKMADARNASINKAARELLREAGVDLDEIAKANAGGKKS